MLIDYIDKVMNTELFNKISADDIKAMFKCLNAYIQFYNKGDIIILEDEEVYNIGLIIYGEVFISKESYDGNRIVISQLKSGEVFGAMVAFSNSHKSPTDIIANNATGVLLIPRDKLINQCSNLCVFHQKIIRNFLGIVSERAIELNKKVALLSIKSIKGKISAYLLEQAKNFGSNRFVIPINRNQLAEYLNVSRPSLSREISILKDDNTIDYHLNSFKLINIEKLKLYTIQ